MNKAELIKGINLTVEGLYAIRDALSAGDTTANTAPAPKTKADTTAAETSTPATGGTYSRSELEKMPYNKFKTLAAKLGVKCTGTRDDIMGRIEKLGVITDDGETTAEPETTTPPAKKGRMTKKTETTAPAEDAPADKSDKPVGGKRGLVKKAAEPAPDEFDAQAKEIADNTPVEEIISALAEVNVKATKKNVIEKLAYALREGLIEPDDEDEDESGEEETDEPETEDGGSDSADDGDDDTDYHSEYDPEGFNDPSEMTDDRREAVENLVDEIQTDFSEGKLTAEQMTDFLTSNCTQEELDLLEDPDDEDALLAFYIEIQKRFVDDGGEKHDPEDPYELDGKDMCCGHPLKYVSKTKKYVCETCGGEYEASDE